MGDEIAAERIGHDRELGLWNPLQVAPDNQPQNVKVLVLNYDPIVPEEGHKPLTQVLGWTPASVLASQYRQLMERASGGYLRFEIVEWRNLNEIYAQADGHRYTVEEYVRNRRAGKGWHEKGGGADYPRILREQNVVPLVDEGLIDEVWIFSDHYFGLWEASMAGPRSFNINGGVYPQVPSQRPFALYGFNYERAVAEMAHNTAHRTEATMNRIYGGWNLKTPTTVWDRFSANHDQSGGMAGVGTCHWPPNAKSDYDYGNPREVLSWADDFLNYPKLTGARKPVSRDTWFDGDYHRGYMRWYFAHLPRAAGASEDGRQNNWWKYLYDFESYTERGQPKPAAARLLAGDLFVPDAGPHRIKVACQSPVPIDPASFDDGDVVIRGPQRERLSARFIAASNKRPGTYRVATYEVAEPEAGWNEQDQGVYEVRLEADAVLDIQGRAVSAGLVGVFVVRSTAAAKLAHDGDTLLLETWDEPPRKQPAVQHVETPWGRGAKFAEGSKCELPVRDHLHPQQGTIEFWIKPDWQGDDKTTRILLEAGQGFNNGLLMQVDGAGNLRLMLWGDDPATPAVERHIERGVGTSTSTWKAGQWHYVAATWDGAQSQLALYVDGRPLATSSDGVKLSSFSRPELKIGSRDGSAACRATLDQLRISARARTASEISAAYEVSLKLEKLRLEPATLRLDPGRRQLIKVFAESQAAARDVTSLIRWSVDKPNVATFDDHGTLTAHAPGNARVTASLGTLASAVDLVVTNVELPSARLVQQVTIPDAETESVRIEVDYSPAIEEASLDGMDVRIAGPNGFHQFVPLEGHRSTANAMRATYRFSPPEQGWSSLAAGEYAIECQAWQVHGEGQFVPESRIGTFEVAPPPSRR